MGLIILKKAKQKTDLYKLRWLLQNPLSKSVISELLQQKNGRFLVEDVFDSYPNRPESLSWLSHRTTNRILGTIKSALGTDADDFQRSLTQPSIRRTVTNVLLTLQKYGVRNPQRFYAPLMIVWNLTWRCNLKCKHCYENAGLLGSRNEASELSLAEKLDVVDQIADAYIPTLSFSGGEPLIHPDFWPVAEKAAETGLYLSLNTNGTLLTKDVARRLADLQFAYVGVSIDSPSAAHHDEFRGVPGCWDMAIEGVKALAGTSVDAILSFTVTNQNFKDLPQVFKMADDLGISRVMIYNFIPTGRALTNIDMDMTPEQREEAMSLIYDYAVAGGSVCGTAPQLGRLFSERGRPGLAPLAHARPGQAENLGIIAELVGGCGVGRAYMALQPDGTITPCVYMPDIKIGHIREKTLLDVWQSNDLLDALATHENLKGSCSCCEYKAVCGGCRARAYYYFGDFKAPDPGCIKNKAYYYEYRNKNSGQS